MKYYRFRIKTTTEAEDVIISAMEEIGLVGAQIEDHVPLSASEKEQQYIYEGAEPDTVITDDGIAYLSFYLSEEELTEVGDNGDGSVLSPAPQGDKQNRPQLSPSVTEIQESINVTLSTLRPHTNIGDGTITLDIMDDADWQDNWKQFFHKFYIDDILILPSWEEDESAGTGTVTHFSPDDEQPSTSAEKRVIVPVPHDSSQPTPAYTLRIDPGTAFGTGAHETTQLCIRALRKYVREGDLILDVGTGSGVLSILALMFGASHAVGTDLDPQVITAVEDNLRRNNIAPDRFDLVMGNLIDDPAVQAEVLRLSSPAAVPATAPDSDPTSPTETAATGYDLVLANILPAVLVPLAPVIPRFLKAGGTYITSGILTERIPEVKAAIEHAGLTVIETTTQGEWNSIVAVY